MNYPVPDSNRKQMLLPVGATCLENTAGTAPGFFMSQGKTSFFFIPGVPWEMKHMLSVHVLPMLRSISGDTRTLFKMTMLSHFGIAEAEVNHRLKEVENVFPGITLGLQTAFPVIQVKLYAQGESEDEIDKLLERAKAWTIERTGDFVFSTRGFSLAQEIGEILVKTNKTLALAESCTGGLIAHMITDVPGSSEYFLFSAVTYSNQAKMAVLNVNEETLKTHGAVSRETVMEMAGSTRRIAGADLGIAVSGIAGPSGGTTEKPVGTVFIGVSTDQGTESHVFRSPFGKRDMNKKIFAMKALDVLWRALGPVKKMEMG
jgi:nicotinamide-nucleotide amidase